MPVISTLVSEAVLPTMVAMDTAAITKVTGTEADTVMGATDGTTPATMTTNRREFSGTMATTTIGPPATMFIGVATCIITGTNANWHENYERKRLRKGPFLLEVARFPYWPEAAECLKEAAQGVGVDGGVLPFSAEGKNPAKRVA